LVKEYDISPFKTSNVLVCLSDSCTQLQTFQWVARLTRPRLISASREFDPHQRPPLFPWERNFTLIA